MTVFLDANIIIYVVERHPVFAPLVIRRLSAALAARDHFMASDLIRMECLIKPFRKASATLEADYRKFFARPEVEAATISSAIAERAARITASNGIRPMDSLHLATAIEYGAGVFLTKDLRLRGFKGLPVELLR